MSGWTRLAGIAAPLLEADIDTDMIFPARFRLPLPLPLPPAEHARVLAAAEVGCMVTIDLAAGTLDCGGDPIAIPIAPRRRLVLMDGRDEIAMMLADDAADIARFEVAQQQRAPWLRAGASAAVVMHRPTRTGL